MPKTTRSILICDDSLLVRKTLREVIEKHWDDIVVLEAADGQLAVQLYEEKHPDLVFMDIVMPSKDGITAVNEIRGSNPGAKIVMLSSVGTQKHLKSAIEAGAFDFIQKPWKKDQIECVIRKAFD